MQGPNNPLLCTDVYKMCHMEQYPEDTTHIYSYLEARKPGEIVFFGLQYYLSEYLTREITVEHVQEFLDYYQLLLGTEASAAINDKLYALAELGYWPIEIKAVDEGSIVQNRNILMSITNTKPGFHWCVGFLESLLLKVWNPCTVATCSLQYFNLVEKYGWMTTEYCDHIQYQVHDFGYRGVSSEETAMISGAAHLLLFKGSDTVSANWFIKEYYNDHDFHGRSVPASEHSVMCASGEDGEFDAVRRMLKLYPKGIVSIVADTFNYWYFLGYEIPNMKSDILNRDGKVVFRPDSGDSVKIICGDPEAEQGSFENKGSLRVLWDTFGGRVNKRGYRELDPKVGLIYGDGMYYGRFVEMLETMEKIGFATSNLVIGVGGILLQNHNRDEHGFSLKATHRKNNEGGCINIYKDPITDQGKKSKKGLMTLSRIDDNNHNNKYNYIYKTYDQVDQKDEQQGYLKPVFKNGKLTNHVGFTKVKDTLAKHLR